MMRFLLLAMCYFTVAVALSQDVEITMDKKIHYYDFRFYNEAGREVLSDCKYSKDGRTFIVRDVPDGTYWFSVNQLCSFFGPTYEDAYKIVVLEEQREFSFSLPRAVDIDLIVRVPSNMGDYLYLKKTGLREVDV